MKEKLNKDLNKSKETEKKFSIKEWEKEYAEYSYKFTRHMFEQIDLMHQINKK